MSFAEEKARELLEKFDGNKLYAVRSIEIAYKEAMLAGLQNSRIEYWQQVLTELSKIK